ncbi:MAG: hypothetical protein JOZ09_04750 [Pseudonocardiales bacterium]|nr:hypothetical protein [Pseudonocardiales bacterium]
MAPRTTGVPVAKHRLAQRQHSYRVLWWLIPVAAALVGGTLTAALVLPGPQPTATQKAAQLTTLPHPDPTTTEEARAYLNALGAHRVALEPHQAVFVGEAVCAQRKQFHASLATLSSQLRVWVPHLSALDAATLVDDADRNLCQVIK